MTNASIKQKLSFNDYLSYDDETDNNYELEDGHLLLMNPPTIRHALIIRFLYKLLEREIEKLDAPWITLQNIGVRTSLKRSRIPDLVVVDFEQIQEKLETSAVIDSPPILVVEIVGPESRIRDYRYKRSEYSVMGIPEYWIIDPDAKKVTVLLLVDGLYEEIIYQTQEKIMSHTFPQLNITVEEILQL